MSTIKLTALMFSTLEAAAKQPLRRVHDDRPGCPAWPAHPSTIRALERHLLLEVSERLSRQGWRIEEWSVTEAAVGVLNPPAVVLVEQPRFLQRFVSSGDYTSIRARAIDPLEAVDAPLKLVELGRVRHREAVERRVLARQLARNGRRAA